MFDGFETFDVEIGAVRIHGVKGGTGPPLLLLHGFPQNHTMWHGLAPSLAAEFTVVATDLRGYGDSGRPPAGDDHDGYSFRAMAADQISVMAHFGFDRIAVVGHDRGARVTHRMVLDHPNAIDRLALLDIMPTAYVYGHVDRRLATAYYHWFFFIQPYDLPEKLIGADPSFYLRKLIGRWGPGPEFHDPRAVAEYERCFADPEVRHAMMEDYRAAASIDLKHDDASADAGERIGAPTLILWGEFGVVGTSADDPLTVWKERAVDADLVSGQAIAGAWHYLVEEQPEMTLDALLAFLTSA